MNPLDICPGSLPGCLVMPLLIFVARIADVSIGTMRLIFVSRGYKKFAAFCGFFEVFIWLVAITQIMQNLTNVFNYVAYAAGFASGNYIGMLIEEKIALGTVLVRVISRKRRQEIVDYLKGKNYGVTVHGGEGLYGNVSIMFTIIPRHDIDDVVAHIRSTDPNLFYTIEDIRGVSSVMPPRKSFWPVVKGSLFLRRNRRKSK